MDRSEYAERQERQERNFDILKFLTFSIVFSALGSFSYTIVDLLRLLWGCG